MFTSIYCCLRSSVNPPRWGENQNQALLKICILSDIILGVVALTFSYLTVTKVLHLKSVVEIFKSDAVVILMFHLAAGATALAVAIALCCFSSRRSEILEPEDLTPSRKLAESGD